jgi:uncharacterized protein
VHRAALASNRVARPSDRSSPARARRRTAGPTGIRVLRNEVESVRGLDVIGADDLWSRRCDPAAALKSRASESALVLVHNPDAADVKAWPEYRGWMLAGHTHGGQCKPPFLPPPMLPVANRRYVAGEVAVDVHRTLYISRGVSYLIRARFNVRPEITVFTLRRSETPRVPSQA